MTTTELIKILQDHEKGAISHKSREISLTINGRYMINPQIKVSSTGDGICGPEIDLDINGEWLESECDYIESKVEELENICANAPEEVLDLLADIKNAPYQVGVLNKIRADIKKMDFDFGDFYDHTDRIREMVIEVIDKCRAESEEV